MGSRIPGSGRKKGTPNKRTLSVQEKLDEMGCDPIRGLAAIAQGDVVFLGLMTQEELDDEGEVRVNPDGTVEWVKLPGREIAKTLVSLDMRRDCWKEVVQYVEPKRKALEVTHPDGSGGVQVVVYLPSDGRDNPSSGEQKTTAPAVDPAGNGG